MKTFFAFLHKHAAPLGLVATFLFALVLRFYKLNAQSLWYDEGNSARIAERSIQLIIEGAAGDIHPPLYYLLLKLWRSLFGSSEFALRSLSVLAGGGLVVFTFLIGRAWANTRVANIAAFLVALSPFGIYYSQETRMYALLAVQAAATTWLLIWLGVYGQRATRHTKRGAAAYVLITVSALYTQYAYPFVLIAQGACFLLALTQQQHKRRVILRYATLNAIAILCYVPWLPIALKQISGWSVAAQSYQLGSAVLDSLRWLLVGRTLPLSDAALPMTFFGCLALLGLVMPASRQRRIALFLFVLAFLPLSLLFVFHLYRDAYLKILLVCVSPLCVLIGLGADALLNTIPKRNGRLGTLFTFAFCVLSFALLAPSLNNLYNNPAYARDDYRGIARMVQQDARADDAVLFLAPNQWEVFTYYYPDVRKTFPLTYRPLNEAAVDKQLQQIVATKKRLFVLYYAEREADQWNWYEQWLAKHTFKADQQWVGNIRLAVYSSDMRARTSLAVIPAQARFGDVITLQSHGLIDLEQHAGDVLPVRLTWQALRKTDRNYKVFVHIGTANGAPVAQNDAEPVAGFRPTFTWNENEVVNDLRAVWIKPDTPSGEYFIYVGLYDADTGERLKLPDDSDRLNIGRLKIS